MKNLDQRAKNLLKVTLISMVVFFGFWYIDNLREGFAFFIGVIQPLIVGLALAYVINLPMSFYERKVFYKLKENEKTKALMEPFSLILAWITIILAISILLNVLIPRIITSFSSLIDKWPLFIDEVERIVKSNEFLKRNSKDILVTISKLNIDEIFKSVKDFLLADGKNILITTSSVFKNVGYVLFGTFVGIVFSTYILMNKKAVHKNSTKFLYAVLPETKADAVYRVFSLSYQTFSSYIKSKMISSTVLVILILVGMLVFRIPYAAMISVLIGVSDFIPIFGPIVGAVVSMILIFIESPLKSLIFIIYVMIAQQIQEKIIYPFMAGKQIGLPPMWIFIAIIVGGSLFGIVGMLIGIPVASIIYTLVNEKINKELGNKEISEKNIVEKILKNKYKRDNR
ncbi:MAG: AI-2E family transporter [Peptoniphilaceae bacterium]|nr:AI-2E family transporter [Peptoniphilaceae bacterium]MDY6018234.1 AI-2E family transporter [Anaerococcus sp.]